MDNNTFIVYNENGLAPDITWPDKDTAKKFAASLADSYPGEEFLILGIVDRVRG